MKYVSFFGSARISEQSEFYAQARDCAKYFASRGCGIITGGGAGIMQAANEGASLCGAPSIGINIKLPHEQHTNPFCTQTKLHTNLSERRSELIARADGFVVCPGGLGTMDELFEVLTMLQTNLSDKKIALLNTAFWRPFEGFLAHLRELKLIDSAPIYCLSDDFAQIYEYLGLEDENH